MLIEDDGFFSVDTMKNWLSQYLKQLSSWTISKELISTPQLMGRMEALSRSSLSFVRG